MWGALGGVAENLSRSVTKLAADVIESATEELGGKAPGGAEDGPGGDAVSSRLAALRARMLSDGSASPSPRRPYELHKKDDGDGLSTTGPEGASPSHGFGGADGRVRRRGSDTGSLFQPAIVHSADERRSGGRPMGAPGRNEAFPGHKEGIVALEAVPDQGLNGEMDAGSPREGLEDSQEVLKLKGQLSRLKGQMMSASAMHEEEQKQMKYSHGVKIGELQKTVQGLRAQLNDAHAKMAAETDQVSSRREAEEARARCGVLEAELDEVRRQAGAESERALRLEQELGHERQLNEQQAQGTSPGTVSSTLEDSAKGEAGLQARVDELQEELKLTKERFLQCQTQPAGAGNGMYFQAPEEGLAEDFGSVPTQAGGISGAREVRSIEIQTEEVEDDGQRRSEAGCFWELQDERQSHARTQAELVRLQEVIQQSQQPGTDAIADRDAFWIKELEQERLKSQEAKEALQQQLEAALVSTNNPEADGLHQELQQEKTHRLQLQQLLSEQEGKALQLHKDVESLQEALQERDKIWQVELVASQSELQEVKQEMEQLKVSVPFASPEAQPDSQHKLQMEASALRQEAKEEKQGRERAEVRAEELQQQLDAKNKGLATDFAVLQDQLDKERAMHTATKHKLAAMQQQSRRAFDSEADLKSRIENELRLKAEAEQALQAARAEIDAQKVRVGAELEQREAVWKQESQHLQLSVTELTAKYEQACLHAEQEGSEKRAESERASIAQQQLSVLQLELDHKHSDLQAAQRDLQAAQVALVQSQKVSSREVASTAERERLLQSRVDECSALRADNERLQGKCHELTSQVEGLLHEKQNLETGVATLTAEVEAACADAERTKQQLSRLKQQMIQIQEDQESQLNWRVDAEVKVALEEHQRQQMSADGRLGKELEEVRSALETATARCEELERENGEWRDASEQKDKEISNLHTALGELTYQSEASAALRRSLTESQAEVEKLRLEVEDSKACMHEAQSSRRAAEDAADMVQRTLQKLEDKARGVRDENIRLKRALEESARKVASLDQNSDTLVDRRIVVKLLVTYIERRNNREVLALMSRMLGFTEEEQQRVGLRGSRRGLLGTVAGMPFALMGRALGGGASSPGSSFADQWVEFLLKQVEEERSSSGLYSLPEDGPADPPSSNSPACYDDPLAHRRTNSAEMEETGLALSLDELPGRGGRSGPISDPGWHRSLTSPLPSSLGQLQPGSGGPALTSGGYMGQQGTLEAGGWGRGGPTSPSMSPTPALQPVGSLYSVPLRSPQNVLLPDSPVQGQFDSRSLGGGAEFGSPARPASASSVGSQADPPWVSTPWRAPSTQPRGQVGGLSSYGTQESSIVPGHAAPGAAGLQGPSLKQYMEQHSQRTG